MPTIDELRAKSAKLPDLNRPQHPSAQTAQPKNSDRLSKGQELAQQSVRSAQGALVSRHQEQMLKLTSALDNAEDNRRETLEALSDRMAYLQDENLFMSDLLGMTQQKLKSVAPSTQKVEVTVIDALIESFEAIAEWEMPQISGSSGAAGGALPAAY